MSRNYSITNNPFVYGFKHLSFEITNMTCGLKTTYYMIDGRAKYPPVATRPSFTNQDKNYTLLNKREKAAYYAGRSIRFLISIPGSAVDIILQIFQSLSTTFELLIPKVESLLRGCKMSQTLSIKIYDVFSISSLFIKIRKWTTKDELSYLANDIGLIGNYEKVDNLSYRYRSFLINKLID